ncbi:hypothetical protein R50073_13210 [Maricurvus nonylphenolicus]|uniref:bile acid:sodium symporter family protein n=1 Tax=Maricurvus nonylphenolicus TaxID=1008307 RepID=UPI0036F3672F
MKELYLQSEYWLAAFQLITAMFGMGAALTTRDFLDVIKEPIAVGTGIAIQILIVPLLAYLFILVLQLPAGIAVGVVILAAIPGGTSSNIFTFLARGNTALSIAVTGLTTLACLITTPIILELLAEQYLPAGFQMPTEKIVQEIFWTLIIPLSLGMLLLNYYPHIAPTISKWSVRVSLFVILLIVIGSSLTGRLDTDVFGPKNMLLFSMLIIVFAFIAWLACRAIGLSRPSATAIEFEVAIRNVNLGILITVSLFPHAGENTDAIGNTVMFCLLFYGAIQLLVAGSLLLSHKKLMN